MCTKPLALWVSVTFSASSNKGASRTPHPIPPHPTMRFREQDASQSRCASLASTPSTRPHPPADPPHPPAAVSAQPKKEPTSAKSPFQSQGRSGFDRAPTAVPKKQPAVNVEYRSLSADGVDVFQSLSCHRMRHPRKSRQQDPIRKVSRPQAETSLHSSSPANVVAPRPSPCPPTGEDSTLAVSCPKAEANPRDVTFPPTLPWLRTKASAARGKAVHWLPAPCVARRGQTISVRLSRSEALSLPKVDKQQVQSRSASACPVRYTKEDGQDLEFTKFQWETSALAVAPVVCLGSSGVPMRSAGREPQISSFRVTRTKSTSAAAPVCPVRREQRRPYSASPNISGPTAKSLVVSETLRRTQNTVYSKTTTSSKCWLSTDVSRFVPSSPDPKMDEAIAACIANNEATCMTYEYSGRSKGSETKPVCVTLTEFLKSRSGTATRDQIARPPLSCAGGCRMKRSLSASSESAKTRASRLANCTRLSPAYPEVDRCRRSKPSASATSLRPAHSRIAKYHKRDEDRKHDEVMKRNEVIKGESLLPTDSLITRPTKQGPQSSEITRSSNTPFLPTKVTASPKYDKGDEIRPACNVQGNITRRRTFSVRISPGNALSASPIKDETPANNASCEGNEHLEIRIVKVHPRHTKTTRYQKCHSMYTKLKSSMRNSIPKSMSAASDEVVTSKTLRRRRGGVVCQYKPKSSDMNKPQTGQFAESNQPTSSGSICTEVNGSATEPPDATIPDETTPEHDESSKITTSECHTRNDVIKISPACRVRKIVQAEKPLHSPYTEPVRPRRKKYNRRKNALSTKANSGHKRRGKYRPKCQRPVEYVDARTSGATNDTPAFLDVSEVSRTTSDIENSRLLQQEDLVALEPEPKHLEQCKVSEDLASCVSLSEISNAIKRDSSAASEGPTGRFCQNNGESDAMGLKGDFNNCINIAKVIRGLQQDKASTCLSADTSSQLTIPACPSISGSRPVASDTALPVSERSELSKAPGATPLLRSRSEGIRRMDGTLPTVISSHREDINVKESNLKRLDRIVNSKTTSTYSEALRIAPPKPVGKKVQRTLSARSARTVMARQKRDSSKRPKPACPVRCTSTRNVLTFPDKTEATRTISNSTSLTKVTEPKQIDTPCTQNTECKSAESLKKYVSSPYPKGSCKFSDNKLTYSCREKVTGGKTTFSRAKDFRIKSSGHSSSDVLKFPSVEISYPDSCDDKQDESRPRQRPYRGPDLMNLSHGDATRPASMDPSHCENFLVNVPYGDAPRPKSAGYIHSAALMLVSTDCCHCSEIPAGSTDFSRTPVFRIGSGACHCSDINRSNATDLPETLISNSADSSAVIRKSQSPNLSYLKPHRPKQEQLPHHIITVAGRSKASLSRKDTVALASFIPKDIIIPKPLPPVCTSRSPANKDVISCTSCLHTCTRVARRVVNDLATAEVTGHGAARYTRTDSLMVQCVRPVSASSSSVTRHSSTVCSSSGVTQLTSLLALDRDASITPMRFIRKKDTKIKLVDNVRFSLLSPSFQTTPEQKRPSSSIDPITRIKHASGTVAQSHTSERSITEKNQTDIEILLVPSHSPLQNTGYREMLPLKSSQSQPVVSKVDSDLGQHILPVTGKQLVAAAKAFRPRISKESTHHGLFFQDPIFGSKTCSVNYKSPSPIAETNFKEYKKTEHTKDVLVSPSCRPKSSDNREESFACPIRRRGRRFQKDASLPHAAGQPHYGSDDSFNESSCRPQMPKVSNSWTSPYGDSQTFNTLSFLPRNFTQEDYLNFYSVEQPGSGKLRKDVMHVSPQKASKPVLPSIHHKDKFEKQPCVSEFRDDGGSLEFQAEGSSCSSLWPDSGSEYSDVWTSASVCSSVCILPDSESSEDDAQWNVQASCLSCPLSDRTDTGAVAVRCVFSPNPSKENCNSNGIERSDPSPSRTRSAGPSVLASSSFHPMSCAPAGVDKDGESKNGVPSSSTCHLSGRVSAMTKDMQTDSMAGFGAFLASGSSAINQSDSEHSGVDTKTSLSAIWGNWEPPATDTDTRESDEEIPQVASQLQEFVRANILSSESSIYSHTKNNLFCTEVDATRSRSSMKPKSSVSGCDDAGPQADFQLASTWKQSGRRARSATYSKPVRPFSDLGISSSCALYRGYHTACSDRPKSPDGSVGHGHPPSPVNLVRRSFQRYELRNKRSRPSSQCAVVLYEDSANSGNGVSYLQFPDPPKEQYQFGGFRGGMRRMCRSPNQSCTNKTDRPVLSVPAEILHLNGVSVGKYVSGKAGLTAASPKHQQKHADLFPPFRPQKERMQARDQVDCALVPAEAPLDICRIQGKAIFPRAAVRQPDASRMESRCSLQSRLSSEASEACLDSVAMINAPRFVQEDDQPLTQAKMREYIRDAREKLKLDKNWNVAHESFDYSKFSRTNWARTSDERA